MGVLAVMLAHEVERVQHECAAHARRPHCRGLGHANLFPLTHSDRPSGQHPRRRAGGIRGGARECLASHEGSFPALPGRVAPTILQWSGPLRVLMSSPRALFAAAGLVVASTAACQGDYDLDKATPGTLGGALQFDVRNAPANALLFLIPSFSAGPTPIALVDP